MLAHRDAVDAEPVSVTVIGLHDHANGIATDTRVGDSRCGADAAFEPMADHAGAAADVPLGNRTTARCSKRLDDVLRAHVLTFDVIEDPVPCLEHDGRRAKAEWTACGDAVRHQRIAHRANRPRARHRDWAAELSAFTKKLEPGGMSHAAEDVDAGEDRVAPYIAVERNDERDPGAHRSLTADAFPRATDQRRMAHRHTRDVRYRVVLARRQTADDDPQVARAGHRTGSVTGKPGRSCTCSSSSSATRLWSRATSASKRSRCALATPTSCSLVGIASRRCV